MLYIITNYNNKTLDLVISNKVEVSVLSDDDTLVRVDIHHPVLNVYFTKSHSLWLQAHLKKYLVYIF